MAILTAFQLKSAADATSAVAEVEAGELWGVSLGPTPEATAVGSILVVQSTRTRSNSLGVHSGFYRTMQIPDFQNLDLTKAMFYGLGKMDGNS